VVRRSWNRNRTMFHICRHYWSVKEWKWIWRGSSGSLCRIFGCSAAAGRRMKTKATLFTYDTVARTLCLLRKKGWMFSIVGTIYISGHIGCQVRCMQMSDLGPLHHDPYFDFSSRSSRCFSGSSCYTLFIISIQQYSCWLSTSEGLFFLSHLDWMDYSTSRQ